MSCALARVVTSGRGPAGSALPTSAQGVEDIFGTTVTRNEVAWLDALRAASDHSDPTLTSRAKATLRDISGDGDPPGTLRGVQLLRRAIWR